MSAVALADRGAESWSGRCTSVGEVVERLSELRHPDDGGPPFTLSGVLNLVGYAPSIPARDEMREVIERLSDHQPSRSVLVMESDAGEGVSAAVSTSCWRAGEHASVAVERVELTLHGEARAGAASALVPLLRSELPTVLWWPAAPGAAGDEMLRRLADLADRIVTEVGREPDAAAALRALADWLSPERVPVTDLAWAAITPWRRLIAQVVDEPALARLRAAPATALVAHPGSRPNAQALLMGGWLRGLVGHDLSVAFEERPGGEDELRGVEIAGSGSGRTLAIEHLPDRGAAAVCVTEPGGAVRRRVLPLPSPDRARLLAGELELQRRDRSFERALPAAARMEA